MAAASGVRLLLQEAAAAGVLGDRVDLTEVGTPLAEATVGKAAGRRFRALLIKSGWSGNGRYYGEEMLRRDGPKAFPVGAQMMSDHPSAQDKADRPEGTITKIMSTIESTPTWDAKAGGLVADVAVVPHFESVLTEDFAKKIALSIRATGMGEHGEAEGRKGLIVNSLDEGGTVDWVTVAGAGGKVLSLLESARPVPLHEGHGMTANDLSSALSDAVRVAYPQDDVWAYVQDYSDEFVIYRVSGRHREPCLNQQTYAVDAAGTATLTGRPVEVNVRTVYVPCLTDVTEATPPSPPPTVPVTESIPTPKGGVVTTPEPTGAPPTGAPASTTAPARLDTVEAANRKVAELTRQLTEARTDAEAIANDRLARVAAEEALDTERLDNARLRAVESVRSITQTALNESGLPACTFPRVLAAVTGPEGAFIPLTEARSVDSTPLKASIESQIKSMQIFVNDVAEALGAGGRVVGLGATSGAATDLTEAQVVERRKARYIRQGMSPDAALIAAKGR